MTERERVRQHFLDLPKTHRWPSASERPGNWYVRLDDAVAALLAATSSVEPGDRDTDIARIAAVLDTVPVGDYPWHTETPHRPEYAAALYDAGLRASDS